MPRKKPLKGKPKVNPELDGMDMEINEFGEIVSNYDLDKVYDFLNKNVDDKKLEGMDLSKDVDQEDMEDDLYLDEDE